MASSIRLLKVTFYVHVETNVLHDFQYFYTKIRIFCGRHSKVIDILSTTSSRNGLRKK